VVLIVEVSGMSNKETVKTYFDRWADGIGWLELNYLHPFFLNGVIKAIPLEKGSRVIDVGCGTGWASRDLSKMVTQGEVVGLDISERLIKKAKDLTLADRSSDYENLVYKVAEAENIPYPSNYFDHAISFVSFSWWVRPDEVLSEIERVLKPSGRLYVADVYDKGMGRMLSMICNCFSSFKENIYSANDYREFLNGRFADVCQRKISPFGWGLLTIGTKTQVN